MFVLVHGGARPTNKLSFVCNRQGWFVALPIVFSAVGVVMVGIGGFSCETFVLKPNGYESSFKFGYTGVEFLGGCIGYTDRDASLWAGYACAMLATVVGCVSAVGAILLAFVRCPPRAVTVLSVLALAAAACGAVVCGVAFGVADCQAAGSSCAPGPMMYVAAAGTLSWIAAGLALLFVASHEREGMVVVAAAGNAVAPRQQQQEDEAATCVSTIINPDGTKTRTTTVTRFEGGQKIVESVTETV
jgi:hypothetical protein